MKTLNDNPYTNSYEDITIEPLHSGSLCSYLYHRGISWRIAQNYCVEIRYYLHGHNREYYAIGFPNRAGGYEIRNPYFKGAIAPKDISIIGDTNANTCLVFEGFMDFLSAVEMSWFSSDSMSAVILNSTSLVERAISALEKAERILCMLDGDDSGEITTAKICNELPQALDSSSLFTKQGFKDLNDLRKSKMLMNNIFNKELNKNH